MAETVFLHLGTPKSGTTYIQAVLGGNRERLKRKDALLFPGRRWADQVHAARDVLNAKPHDYRPPETAGAWDRLCEEIAAWDGNAVVSMEWLGSARAPHAKRMVESLAPARVEVIVTVRDLARTLSAAWQEFVQNWETWTWSQFLADVSDEQPMSSPAGRLFWAQQDLSRLLSTWCDVLSPERIHVVTLPPPGSPAGELWARFASVLDIGPHRYDASGGGGNESLGLESTEMMRRLNVLSKQQGMSWPVYDARVKHGLAKRGLSARKGVETRVTVPAELHPWVRSRAEEQVAAVKVSGAHVVGDLDDLSPALAAPGPQPEDLGAETLLDSALAGLVFAATDHANESARLRRRIERLQDRLRAQVAPPPAPTPPPPPPPPDVRTRLKQRLVALSERNRALGLARRAYVRGRDTVRR